MVNRPPGIPADAEIASTGGFNKYVGPLFRLSDLENGAVKRFAFAAAEQHMNGGGTVHGGMLMTFMDTSMSRTSRLISEAKGTATVSLTCDFVAPARLGDVIESRVRVTRRTRTIVFLSCELVTGDKLLMVGSGVWKISGAEE
ncbi:MAG: PaaI family thioesterase [Rhizomicrobium sp.]